MMRALVHRDGEEFPATYEGLSGQVRLYRFKAAEPLWDSAPERAFR
ncbi:hypothetical protein AB0M39_13665 [Streptomyces sp. NPDC051907]